MVSGMSIVVQKYGGSSVATPEQLKKVARRVIETEQAGHSVVVVVSAMADTTDDLLSLSEAVTRAPERRELDMLVTAGERISMALLSMAIRELGGESISFTGSQAGILTNDRHVDARIIEVRPVRIQDELEKGKIVIVAGYQGMSYKREITTLGRGGSDTTAVALAAALDAEWCEICSDVDGVYSADPRVVPNARRIPQLSYEETHEMAEKGAKVLNARAVEFAEEKGIAIYARATASQAAPDIPKDGTVVRKNAPRPPGTVVGIAHRDEVFLLRGNFSSLEEPFAWMKAMNLPLFAADFESTPSGYRMTLTAPVENLPNREKIQQSAAEKFGETLAIHRDLGSVTAVGTGITEDISVLVTASQALQHFDISSVSTNPRGITWVLPSAQVSEATKSLHTALIESRSDVAESII